MNFYKIFTIAGLLALVVMLSQCKSIIAPAPASSQASIADLGRHLFFDVNLSNPGGQSCASCHDSSTAFSSPIHAIVTPGVIPTLVGNRNAPSIAYAQFFPPLYWSPDDTSYLGGQFIDGRVNTLEDQAKAPFLNLLEMNNDSRQMVVDKIKQASYFDLFKQIYGDVSDTTEFYSDMASAIATYERSASFAQFTSKFDYYLKGQATLTAQETRGMILFNDTLRANCANCHLSTPDPVSGKVLFTDMTYDNLGIPKNPENPYYKMDPSENPEGAAYIDRGLGSFLSDPEFDGFFKTPSLRNVAITAPYFHNGIFDSLIQVVHFYNTRDTGIITGEFAQPEVPGNMDTQMLGHMGLTRQEEEDIAAFLGTLTDGYK